MNCHAGIIAVAITGIASAADTMSRVRRDASSGSALSGSVPSVSGDSAAV